MFPVLPNQTPVMYTDVDIQALIRRQDEIERELGKLREQMLEMKEKNHQTVERIHGRIDKLEDELADLRKSLDMIQTGVSAVQQHVSDINAKQDITMNTQKEFINQLWKAFFIVLGVVVTGATAAVALLK